MPHQLTVILFSDIVGYTALMGKDENKALEILKANREIHKQALKQFNGKFLKEMGDGVLARFDSTLDAVQCAGAMLQGVREPGEYEIRIGIHQGEVVSEAGDIHGDGVNIASRIQEQAQPNQILVSEAVFQNVQNKSGITGISKGSLALKNVNRPIEVFALEVDVSSVKTEKLGSSQRILLGGFIMVILLVAALLIFQNPFSKQVSEPGNKSIAILPFEDLSQGQNQAHFAEGMMIELLEHLFKIKDLRVTSRSATLKYRQTVMSPAEIADELGVSTLMEGSVRKDGDRIKISIKLIDAISEQYIWQETYERNVLDMFGVQSEVAQRVAQSLQAEVTPEVKLRIENIPTTSEVAYEYYLLGREQQGKVWEALDPRSLELARTYYSQSIAVDPEYSDAYAGLGEIYWLQAHFDLVNYKPSLWDSSIYYSRKALEINPENGEAYSSLALVEYLYHGDQEKGYALFQKAVELSPSSPDVYGDLDYFYMRLGECDSLEKIQDKLNVLYDELAPSIAQQFLRKLCRQDMEGVRQLPASEVQSLAWKTALLLHQRIYEEAIDVSMETLRINPFSLLAYSNLGEAYGMIGNVDQAVTVLAQLDSLSETMKVWHAIYAPIYFSIGADDLAYEKLKLSVKDREIIITHLHIFSAIVSQHKDEPQYQELMDAYWVTKLE